MGGEEGCLLGRRKIGFVVCVFYCGHCMDNLLSGGQFGNMQFTGFGWLEEKRKRGTLEDSNTL